MRKLFSRGKLFLFGIFILLSTTGSECENFLEPSGDLSGTWELVKMEGNLQDVCLGEIVQYSGNNATLRCPGSTAISRPYTYANNVLTYTGNNISYDVTFTSSNGVEKMVQRGRGIERVLTYNRIN